MYKANSEQKIKKYISYNTNCFPHELLFGGPNRLALKAVTFAQAIILNLMSTYFKENYYLDTFIKMPTTAVEDQLLLSYNIIQAKFHTNRKNVYKSMFVSI